MVFEQTQEDSLTDPLTQLPNTRFMFMHLTRELARAERLKSEVSLLVMDLDNFKDINDTYGHHVGDRALREVAGVLRAGIRPYDICVRYAGDEFIVVLSGCGGEEAERKRLELQRAVDGLQFEARPGKMLPLAISIGASVFPHDGDSYETLLATADSRMYRDKTRRKRETAGEHDSDELHAAGRAGARVRRRAAARGGGDSLVSVHRRSALAHRQSNPGSARSAPSRRSRSRWRRRPAPALRPTRRRTRPLNSTHAAGTASARPIDDRQRAPADQPEQEPASATREPCVR